MIRHKSPADLRPFQSREKLASQEALVNHYRQIGIQDVAEALHHLKPASERPTVATAA